MRSRRVPAPRYSGTAKSTGRAKIPNQSAATIIDRRTSRPFSLGSPNSPWAMKPKYTMSSSTIPPT